MCFAVTVSGIDRITKNNEIIKSYGEKIFIAFFLSGIIPGGFFMLKITYIKITLKMRFKRV